MQHSSNFKTLNKLVIEENYFNMMPKSHKN